MEENKSKTPKYCVNCRYYETFYIKGACRFLRESKGYCFEHKKMSTNHETCENWVRKTGNRKDMHKRASWRILKKMAKDVEQIRQILEEDVKETEESAWETTVPELP